jgi:hypothetical protein
VIAIGGEQGDDFRPAVESDDADAELGSERNTLLPELLNLLTSVSPGTGLLR